MCIFTWLYLPACNLQGLSCVCVVLSSYIHLSSLYAYVCVYPIVSDYSCACLLPQGEGPSRQLSSDLEELPEDMQPTVEEEAQMVRKLIV